MRITLRPSRPRELALLLGRARPPQRCRLLTAFAGEEPIGIGGLTFTADGCAWATLALKPEARRYGPALLRAWRLVRDRARADGYRVIYAKADPAVPGAEEFLRRLGFQPLAHAVAREVWMLPLEED